MEELKAEGIDIGYHPDRRGTDRTAFPANRRAQRRAGQLQARPAGRRRVSTGMSSETFLARAPRRIRAMLTGEMKKWETEDGVRFLGRIGVKPGQTVIDFGCGAGRYSIPAAVVVGPGGMVYAIDRNLPDLDKLERRIADRNPANLKTIRSSGNLAFEFENESADVVLLYDMLHYLPAGGRAAVFLEARRVLRNTGFLSVYPKHLAEDCPADHFRNLSAGDLIREIEKAGFLLKARIAGTMSHDHGLVHGYVLNFEKAPGSSG